MFWNKKELAEIETLKQTILENIANYTLQMKLYDSHINLILDHLKLKYVPETETKEPAKLVEKTGDMVGDSILSLYYPWGGSSPIKNPTKPKKKGRPKKK